MPGLTVPKRYDAMTDVELTRLLTDLETTAEALNRESDTVNTLIEQFEAKLRALNVGLDVWTPVDDGAQWDQPVENARGDEVVERQWEQTELGFIKTMNTHGERVWGLAVRSVLYRRDDQGDWEIINPGRRDRLLDASRVQRIAALKAFPRLVVELHNQAKAALQTIRAAQKLVK
jgi:hypothetical protein